MAWITATVANFAKRDDPAACTLQQQKMLVFLITMHTSRVIELCSANISSYVLQ